MLQMGMYDEIQWDYWLPDEEHIGKTFQTKDLCRSLSQYKIEENGYLHRRIRKFWEPVDCTTNITLYTFADKMDGKMDKWVQYHATIESGKVILVYKAINDE
jgi:hypothetical protein